MSFRRRLLLALALIVLVTVGSVSIVVSWRTRRSFEQADAERTQALLAQFRSEFTRRSDDVAHRVASLTGGDQVYKMALDLSRGGDTSSYVTEAKVVADSYQLDLLDFTAADGTIISSAQWPARFGYKENFPPDLPSKGTVLRLVPLPDGATLGLVAASTVKIADNPPIIIVGGRRLDRQ